MAPKYVLNHCLRISYSSPHAHSVLQSKKLTKAAGILIRTLHPSSSVSLSNHFVVLQKHTTASASLQVSKISWNGSNTAWSYDRSFSLESVADIVPGTHITALARFEAGVDTAFVYAQVHGDDVTEFSRPLDGDDGSGWRRRDRAREIRD